MGFLVPATTNAQGLEKEPLVSAICEEFDFFGYVGVAEPNSLALWGWPNHPMGHGGGSAIPRLAKPPLLVFFFFFQFFFSIFFKFYYFQFFNA
jgi:hypothetical protein